MKYLFILPILLLVTKCVTLTEIKKPADLKRVQKDSSLVYAKIKVKALLTTSVPQDSIIDSGGIMRINDFHSWTVYRETNFYDKCVLLDSNKINEIIIGSYVQEDGKRRYYPKITKEWKFDIPQKAPYYYLGTITQDKEISLVIEESNLDKDECDRYVASIVTNFDPKATVVLKAKKFYKQ